MKEDIGQGLGCTIVIHWPECFAGAHVFEAL